MPSRLPEKTVWPTDFFEKRDDIQARAYLRELAKLYEKHLRCVFDVFIRDDLRWSGSVAFIDEVAGDFQVQYFFLKKKDGSPAKFWLWGFSPNRRGGRLRLYIERCARNFARNLLRRKKVERQDLDYAAIAANNAAATDPEEPEDNLDAIASARRDKMHFLSQAIDCYRDERGSDSIAWQAFDLYELSGRGLTQTQVAVELGLGLKKRAAVNNYVTRGRQRIMELIWLQLNQLSSGATDTDADMRALFGDLPDSRKPPNV